jgi:hypothetical protein
MSDGPWSDYATPTAPDEGPWKDYATPASTPAASATPQVGYGEDIGKGAVGGLGRGTTGLVGLPGTVGSFGRWALGKAGVPEYALATGAEIAKHVPGISLLTLPDGSQIQKKVEEYTGDFYQPKTIPGQYASTLAEFAPGMLIPGGGSLAARAANTVAGAVGSETAGQLTKGTAAEPYARAIGGVVTPFAAAKAITPIGPASQAYQGAVRSLEAEGIPLTAGQRTGSQSLRYLESNAKDMPLVGGQATRLEGDASNALDRAVTDRVYPRAELTARGVPENVNLPDPRVAMHGPEILSDNYTRLTQAPFVTNPQFQNRMTRAQTEYERLVQSHNRTPNIEATQNDIIDRLVAGQGRMAGDEYQSIRSQIGTAQRAPGVNPNEQRALTEYKRAMDEAYMAGLPPADARALAENNRRYALMKQTQSAVDAASEHLSPARLAAAVRARRPAGQYAARSGDLDELAAAAKTVMSPLPNSGTAARTGVQQAFMGGGGGVIGTTIGGLVGGIPGAALGAVAGAAMPFVPSYLATTRAGQAYLGNRALPQNARDIVTQALVQQGISQPSGVARNKSERDAYDERLRRIYITGR